VLPTETCTTWRNSDRLKPPKAILHKGNFSPLTLAAATVILPFQVTGWVWVLFSGAIGILVGAYLWPNMPLSSERVLGVLLGIQLICEGAALTFLAWMVRSA
jgi:uncharacterized membrane protein HdeD (DUF308 family)